MSTLSDDDLKLKALRILNVAVGEEGTKRFLELINNDMISQQIDEMAPQEIEDGMVERVNLIEKILDINQS